MSSPTNEGANGWWWTQHAGHGDVEMKDNEHDKLDEVESLVHNYSSVTTLIM